MSVKLAGSETSSFHGISCLPLNFKDEFCSLGNVSLFARDHKILPSNFLMIPQTTRERILNFWSPNNTEGDSEFLTPKQHSRFRISDPPINTGEDSEFLTPKKQRRGFRISDPQTTQERIQNFWSPKQHRSGFRVSDPPNNTGQDSEFLIPKQHRRFRISDSQTTQEIQNFWSPKQQRRGYRISDPLNKNTIPEGFQYFRTPKNIVVESEFLITQTTWEKLHAFFSGLKAVKSLKINTWFWSYSGAVQGLIVPRYKLYSIASIVLHPTLNFIIEGFNSCCPPDRCLIIFFSW